MTSPIYAISLYQVSKYPLFFDTRHITFAVDFELAFGSKGSRYKRSNRKNLGNRRSRVSLTPTIGKYSPVLYLLMYVRAVGTPSSLESVEGPILAHFLINEG